MLTVTVLLAGLLPASEPPAKRPAAPPAALRVAAGPGIRVAVPPLGQATPADKKAQRQVFAFYVGLFGR